MTDMRQAASQLAARGRFGDSMLIHVSPAEVEGIASLIPGGLTINPHTGLPEAFFFLPFLASLFGAAAPAAAAATAAAPAIAAGAATAAGAAGAAGAIGAGASTAAMTAGALAPSALAAAAPTAAALAAPTLTAGAAAPAIASTVAPTTVAGSGGLSSLLGGAGADALAPTVMTHSFTSGAPTIASGTLASAADAALPIASNPALTAGVSALPQAATAAPSITPVVAAKAPLLAAAGPSGPVPASLMSAAGGPSGPVLTTGFGTAAGPSGPVPASLLTKTPAASTKGGLGSLMTSKNLPLAMVGLSGLSNALSGMGGKEKKEKGKDVSKMKYKGGAPVFSKREEDAAYREHNFFPNYQYANGGIVALADGGMVDPQMQPPQDMSFPMNGVPAGAGSDEAPMLEDIPSSPYPASQIGAEPEPAPGDEAQPSTDNDRELIAQTVEAIQGKVPDPGPILLAFVNEFGEPALQDLAMRVKAMPPGGGPAGPNDGQSDSIPAMIDGQQPAALSEGEFVVPADAVSGLGNGSTDAGAQQLQGMVDGVRQMRTGGTVQPPAINPQDVMPYAEGGLVSLYKKGGQVKREMQGPVDPLYDLDQYGPGVIPEAIDQWIPSVAGYTTTGDPFATGPEIRRGIAMRERAEAARQRR